jgi:hypothetical protein
MTKRDARPAAPEMPCSALGIALLSACRGKFLPVDLGRRFRLGRPYPTTGPGGSGARARSARVGP